MKRILFVEDDKTIASALQFSLEQEGYDVLHKTTVQSTMAVLDEAFDLVLLDLNLPDGSGFEICRSLSGRRDLPILILSAVDDEANIVMGLELGALDYVTKPFRLRELLTRIRGILRRNEKGEHTVYQLNELRLDALKAKVYHHNREVFLSALEYRLLLLLMQNQGQVLSREQILDGLWDVDGQFISDNTLSVYIKRIREKIGDPQGDLIKTVRGLGYKAGT